METEQILQEQARNAPEEIKNILKGDLWSQQIERTIQINHLSLEEKTALENEVLFVLLGMSLLSKLTDNIQSSLSIDKSLAEEIASEIKTKIINPVETLLPTIEEEEKTNSLVPEIPPEDLPAIVPGETAHDTEPLKQVIGNIPTNLPTDDKIPSFEARNDTPNMDKPEEGGIDNSAEAPKPTTQTHYAPGQDPYREPIE